MDDKERQPATGEEKSGETAAPEKHADAGEEMHEPAPCEPEAPAEKDEEAEEEVKVVQPRSIESHRGVVVPNMMTVVVLRKSKGCANGC